MRDKKKGRKGRYLIAGGLLLIAAALCLTVFNIGDDWRAGREAGQILAEMEKGMEEDEKNAAGENGADADGQALAVIPVDGNSYMGVLEIPDLDLTLPVMADWSYPKLRVAPCRYMGSA